MFYKLGGHSAFTELIGCQNDGLNHNFHESAKMLRCNTSQMEQMYLIMCVSAILF